jgi:F-type H+-transporting ATPase subunit delta
MSENSKRQFKPTADVGALGIARVYAEALLAAADKQGQADAVLEELSSLLDDVLGGDPAAEAFLGSPIVPENKKAETITGVFGPRASALLTDFLQVLNKHRRLNLLRHVRFAYGQMLDERRRRVRVQVRSAVPLTDEQKTRIGEMVGRALNLEPVLESREDPALLGGLVVRVRDVQFDGSLRTRLEKIRNQIIERSSHEIQRRRDRFSSDAGN